MELDWFGSVLLLAGVGFAVFFPAHVWGLSRGYGDGWDAAANSFRGEADFQMKCAECNALERDNARARIKELEGKIEAAKDLLE